MGIGGDGDEGPLTRPHSRADLVEWLVRMGVTGLKLGQPLENKLFPTIVVDDVSHLAAPLATPLGGVGIFTIGAIGGFTTAALQPAPGSGGLYLTELRTLLGGVQFSVHSSDVDLLLAPILTVVPALRPTGLPLATVRTGTIAAGASTGVVFNGNTIEIWRPPNLYIPPGTQLLFTASATGLQVLALSFTWQEIPGA